MARIRVKSAGKIISWLIRGIVVTMKLRIDDRAGVTQHSRDALIWAFWHQNMFLMPWLKEHLAAHVPGTILSSPSGDGQIIADVCAEFGLEAARGSSSRPQQGMSALIMLAEKVRAKEDVAITPDGPRGPAHHIHPGLIKLAQLTGARIMPVHVRYSRAIRFKTWDQFLLPLPFTNATIIFDDTHTMPRRMGEDEFEQQRSTIERVMVKDIIEPNSSC